MFNKSQIMKRRAFITAAAATAPLLATGARATTDPVVSMVKEWFHVKDNWLNFVEGSVEDQQAWNRREVLAEKICTATPITPEGIVAQLEYALDDFGEYMVGNFHKDLDHKLFANIITGAKGLV